MARAKGEPDDRTLRKGLPQLASCLRARIDYRLEHEEDECRPAFKPDMSATTTTEAGSIPENWEQYVAAVRRPGR
eukprot:1997520-Alexandrium_andersonii.AAC.1